MRPVCGLPSNGSDEARIVPSAEGPRAGAVRVSHVCKVHECGRVVQAWAGWAPFPQGELRMRTPALTSRLGAEALGTFWLVFGGCGSAIFSAKYLAPNDETGQGV